MANEFRQGAPGLRFLTLTKTGRVPHSLAKQRVGFEALSNDRQLAPSNWQLAKAKNRFAEALYCREAARYNNARLI